ncbi:Putative phospholipid-binding domain family [Synechococcus sp. PCC 7335]|uniref:BON domain-containing protein n=1 Tax=Synechococcus sp. (strain ATCC 29403 / PCC 7335) TaxID=91464 RepID=UPI00017ECAF9|nr:BON domain-containing protein [Synechococcus sp. PCC 7335]EDX84950.1 Putative phospholipid-binding domain family [Synechococcus sp. PCC 7335]
MKKTITTVLAGVLMLGVAACDTARTSADAPSDVGGEVETPAAVEETVEDAESEVRQAQLDSDIRAREQRNEVLGDEGERADSDIESEVRAKLEANIPRGKLTIDAEDGNVAISGTVPSEKEYETIEPLAGEILGVESVAVDVEIAPAAE